MGEGQGLPEGNRAAPGLEALQSQATRRRAALLRGTTAICTRRHPRVGPGIGCTRGRWDGGGATGGPPGPSA
eukprot:6740971-Alexandrium_andersonii.AAC.1